MSSVVRAPHQRAAAPPSERFQTACRTVGCTDPRATEGNGYCVACLVRRCEWFRQDAARWRARYGRLYAAARQLVRVLGRDADGDLSDPAVARPWLGRLRDAHGTVERLTR